MLLLDNWLNLWNQKQNQDFVSMLSNGELIPHSLASFLNLLLKQWYSGHSQVAAYSSQRTQVNVRRGERRTLARFGHSFQQQAAPQDGSPYCGISRATRCTWLSSTPTSPTHYDTQNWQTQIPASVSGDAGGHKHKGMERLHRAPACRSGCCCCRYCLVYHTLHFGCFYKRSRSWTARIALCLLARSAEISSSESSQDREPDSLHWQLPAFPAPTFNSVGGFFWPHNFHDTRLRKDPDAQRFTPCPSWWQNVATKEERGWGLHYWLSKQKTESVVWLRTGRGRQNLELNRWYAQAFGGDTSLGPFSVLSCAGGCPLRL